MATGDIFRLGSRPGSLAARIFHGLDGRVLNGSLLPARMAFDGTLTDHWSILTAIGDGVVFIQGRQGRAAGDVVRKLGRRVRDSGVPGIVVLNLHPQNIELTEDMHVAARELVQDGFVAWTMSEMIDWFRARDHAHLAGTMMQTVSVGECDLRESERPKISQRPPFRELKARVQNFAKRVRSRTA